MKLDLEGQIKEAAASCNNRHDLITRLILASEAKTVAEIGVYRAELSAHLLQHCTDIESYLLIDPWRNLASWNKPANHTDEKFEDMFQGVLSRLESFRDKTVILRGCSLEVIKRVEDENLDFVYIDGDHTLRGIVTDCLAWWQKLKVGGLMVGDDMWPSIWHHGLGYEPTLVFPFVVHFAEGVGAPLYALPHNQYAIVKPQAERNHRFIDLSQGLGRTDLMAQFQFAPLTRASIVSARRVADQALRRMGLRRR